MISRSSGVKDRYSWISPMESANFRSSMTRPKLTSVSYHSPATETNVVGDWNSTKPSSLKLGCVRKLFSTRKLYSPTKYPKCATAIILNVFCILLVSISSELGNGVSRLPRSIMSYQRKQVISQVLSLRPGDITSDSTTTE